MTTNFSLTGGPQLQRRLTAIGQAPKDMLRDIGLGAVEEAKRLVPRRTGNLARTIRIGSLTADHVEVMAGGRRDVGYAASVEFGSKAHVIVPKPGRVGRNGRPAALAWGGARTLGGRLRAGSQATNFARRVNHPGTRAKPYLIPGLEKALKLVGLDGLVKRWNGAA